MHIRIQFTPATTRALTETLRKAYSNGDLRLVRRIPALLACGKGEAIDEVAATWGVVQQTIYNWLKAFLLDGMDSLVYRSSPGRPPKLTKTQKRRLKELIEAGPLAAGYASGCWTSLLIQQLILREFGVLYNRFYVCELLHNLGFSFQKAKFVSDHLDEERRHQWMTEVWPPILREAKRKGGMILFGDEAGFAQWGSLGYTWAPVGEQPVVQTTGKRKAYKAFGVIDFFSGGLIYQGHEGRFTSASYQAFQEEVLARTTCHLFLIQDGAKYHTSKPLREFFAQHADRLTVYQLPSYSPDYNPIEFLWKNTKRRATHNRYFPEFEALIVSVEEALAYFAQHPEEVKNLMGLYVESMVATPAAA